jgi:endonuclease III
VAAPHELQRRLGHLDPERLGHDLEGIAKAVATPPMLQRFINTIPPWIASAGRRVVRDYGGDAGRIWGDAPTAKILEGRLEAFDGIGQKKAAMAVEILERDLKVPIRELHGTDIAYDVHVRRVFLRTGLAERDDRDHMIEQGRRLNPANPGAIDLPMWLVGRRWCRPGVPLCPECPLFGVCPRLVDRAANVHGA